MTVIKVNVLANILAITAASILAAQPEISISGKVTDGTNPLAGAKVSLVSDSTIADTTDVEGKFKISNAGSVHTIASFRPDHGLTLSIKGTMLSITNFARVEQGAVSLYNVNGRRVITILVKQTTGPDLHFSLPRLNPGWYLLSARTGNITIERKLVAAGSSFYLNELEGVSGAIRALTTDASVNEVTLKVTKEGYTSKTVTVAGYKTDTLTIPLQKSDGGRCIEGKWSTTDVTKKGPYETVLENVTGASLYRPKEMLNGCLYPVITWGHGAMGSPRDYNNLLHILASHGFVVIASTAENVQNGGNSGNNFRNKMVEVAEWVVKESEKSTSVLYQKIATDKIGAAGHSQGGYGATECGQNPLITTSVSSCGAVGSGNLKGPALILCGGKDNNSGARCSDHPEAAYSGINNVPVMKAEHHNADHGWSMDMMGSSSKDKPHEMLMAMTAWFRYHLMGDEEYRSWFYGTDCYLCKQANWTVKRKKMD